MWFGANFKMQDPSANHSSLTRGNRIQSIGALTSEMGYVLLLIGTEAKNLIVQYMQVLDMCVCVFFPTFF